jgi:hypothetical protein
MSHATFVNPTHPVPVLFQVELLSSTMDRLTVAWKAAQAVATLPFDTMRAQYAEAVRAGWLPRSMLASRDVGRAIGALEELTLGPLARRR